MSLLITGGTGFLGSYLARDLLKEGRDDIVLFDSYVNEQNIENIKEYVEVVKGNITNWTDIVETIKKYNIKNIIHLAAIASSSAVKNSPLTGYEVNVGGTVNILEAARIFGINKVIFSSSISTFGPEVEEPVKEEYSQRPTNLYGITKVAGELWGGYYYQDYNIDFRVLRFPRIINPGRRGKGVIVYPSLLIEKAVTGEEHTISVSKDFRVPIIYIKDAVKLLKLLYGTAEIKTRYYNIAGFIPTAQQIAEEIDKLFPDNKIKFAEKPVKPHLTIPLRYDDKKVKEELNWNYAFDTIEKIIKDFRKELQY